MYLLLFQNTGDRFDRKTEYFKEECAKFSKAGHHISEMVYGQEHNVTKGWKERNEDFENWYKKMISSPQYGIPSFLEFQ